MGTATTVLGNLAHLEQLHLSPVHETICCCSHIITHVCGVDSVGPVPLAASHFRSIRSNGALEFRPNRTWESGLKARARRQKMRSSSVALVSRPVWRYSHKPRLAANQVRCHSLYGHFLPAMPHHHLLRPLSLRFEGAPPGNFTTVMCAYIGCSFNVQNKQ